LEAFTKFGSDLDAATQAKLNRGRRTIEVLKQPLHKPLPVEKQVVILYALTHGFLDSVPVDQILDFEEALYDYFDGHHEAIMFKHLTANGLFPNGGIAIVSVMLAVNYAFSGTELIGIAAGETDNPKEAVPRAIKTTIGRLVIFFVLTIVVLASLLPMKEAGVSSAPFVDVFDKMGIPFAADIMNFVILTAILSAGNSGLYASSRMLWSLANEGMLNKKLVKINKHGVPMIALLISMAGAVLSLFSSIYAADTVYLALVSIAGFAVVVVWLSIPMAQINFRKQWNLEHSDDELDYKTPFNPILPYITIVLLAISVLGIAWDSSQRAGLYFGIPFMIFCYLYHYLRFKKW